MNATHKLVLKSPQVPPWVVKFDQGTDCSILFSPKHHQQQQPTTINSNQKKPNQQREQSSKGSEFVPVANYHMYVGAIWRQFYIFIQFSKSCVLFVCVVGVLLFVCVGGVVCVASIGIPIKSSGFNRDPQSIQWLP